MERNNLSSILSDGMVLQRGDKTKIFGTTVENSKIEVWFLGENMKQFLMVKESGVFY